MNAFERFAIAMSILLYEMRTEDLYPTSLSYEDQHGNNHYIPENYINEVLQDEHHSEVIHERLRLAVLEEVLLSPLKYENHKGKLAYNNDIYDHEYLIDEYIQNQFIEDHPEFHILHICSKCDSDNVQIKAWVRPNQNYKYVDEVNDGDELGFCDDCLEHVIIDIAEVNTRHKVLGFQVVNRENTKLHPAMFNVLSLYDTMQANEMIRDETVPGLWQLKAVWTIDIPDPVIMFEGLPQK